MEKNKVQNDKIQSNGKISNKDLERVNVEPAALSDADLDNVAGGTLLPSVTNYPLNAAFNKTTYTVK